MSLRGSITAALDFVRTSVPELGSSDYKLSEAWVTTIANGTGLNQATKIIVRKVTLAALAAVTLDLDAGTISDPSGVTSGVVAALSRVVLLAIKRTNTPAASTQDENIALEGDFVTSKLLATRDSGGVDPMAYIPIRPGGKFLMEAPDATGIAVTASTGDAITVTNLSSADEITFEIVVVGS